VGGAGTSGGVRVLYAGDHAYAPLAANACQLSFHSLDFRKK
jgi:hypothetical protein